MYFQFFNGFLCHVSSVRCEPAQQVSWPASWVRASQRGKSVGQPAGQGSVSCALVGWCISSFKVVALIEMSSFLRILVKKGISKFVEKSLKKSLSKYVEKSIKMSASKYVV